MRATHGNSALPQTPGTATHLPFCLPRYSAASLTLPLPAISVFMTSSIGTRLSACAEAYQVGIDRMSCPDLACASAAIVSSNLSPFEVMKSIFRSILFLSAHSWQILRIGSSAVGTQWSQKPQDSRPAAWAPLTNGMLIVLAPAAAAAVRSRVRLVSFCDTVSSGIRRGRENAPCSCGYRYQQRTSAAAL